MQTYYVATLSHYVLVEAVDEADARRCGHVALRELYMANGQEPLIQIRVVRHAHPGEIDLQRWHDQRVAEFDPSSQTTDGPFVCPYCDLGWEPSA